jgi:DNA-binding GntR family transcriptional regulator
LYTAVVQSRGIVTEAVRVYLALRKDIIACDLQPGASVSEADMCTRYKASRTPVREACHRLQEEALVQIVPFRGYFISPLTSSEYRNLMEMQLIVDPSAAALAAERATDAQIKSIERWAGYVYHPGQKKSYETFLEWNRNLHVEIAAATGNESLADITSNLQTRLIRYFYLVISMASYGQDLVQEHDEIVKAIRARKPELARERAEDHVRQTIERTSKIEIPG